MKSKIHLPHRERNSLNLQEARKEVRVVKVRKVVKVVARVIEATQMIRKVTVVAKGSPNLMKALNLLAILDQRVGSVRRRETIKEDTEAIEEVVHRR